MSLLTFVPHDAFAVATAAPLSIHFDSGKGGGVPVADALKIILLLTAIAVLPAIVVAMTSFSTRTIIVLSMLRHGFGMQDTPPNIVLLSIALFLTLFTMAPAIEEIYSKSLQPLSHNQISLEDAVRTGIAPLRDFMIQARPGRKTCSS